MPRSSSRLEEPHPGLAALEGAIEAFARRRGIGTIEDLSPSRASYRRTYRLGDRLVAKAFLPEARDPYERELAFLENAMCPARAPALVEARLDAREGGYLVMTALEGEALEGRLESLAEADYLEVIADLARCIAEIHGAPLERVAHLGPNGLEAERRGHFEALDESLACLREAGVVPEAAIAELVDGVAAARAAAFAGPWRFIHGDVHRANVFVERRDGRWSCALIDFEACGPNRAELDLVYPFLSILGEAFPGRRLGTSWERAWRRFAEGYGEVAGSAPDRALIAGHAVAWFLWVAAHSYRIGHPKHLMYAGLALEACGAGRGEGAPCLP